MPISMLRLGSKTIYAKRGKKEYCESANYAANYRLFVHLTRLIPFRIFSSARL